MKRSVFVLEDDDSLRELFTIMLEEEEYEVKSYPNATSFKESLSREKPDIIIMDVILPDGNGLEICAEIKKDDQTKEIPIIMMSAHQDFTKVKDIFPAEAFITKPFDVDYFLDQVQRYA